MTLERIALAVLMALMGWVTLTVQQLSVQVAVLSSIGERSVSVTEFTAFYHQTQSKLDSHQVWLTRLSDRINKLETEDVIE